jgi:uncharacterized membrane protein
MALMILGLLIFAGVHFIPSLAPGFKASWHHNFGEAGYKGTYSLLLVLSFVLMSLGWRSAQPELVYLPLADLLHPAMALVAIGFLLIVVSNRRSRVRLWVRHPQLTGVLLWAVAHLMMNGDNRSVVLFGALAAWSCAEILAINRREGVWIKGDAPGLGTELVTVLITAVVIALVVAAHPYISGMPVL